MRRELSSICALILLSAACLAAPRIAPKKVPARPASAPVADSLHEGSLTLHRCVGGRAYCGSIERPLDPSGTVAGTIKIGFEFYPHTDNSQPPLEAIVAEEGGPGYATTGSRDGYLALFAPLHDRRDILLVDDRGTGRSQALDCPLLQREPNPRFPGIRACGSQLGDTAYLYGSGLGADDLAAVLDALGIPIINLYGDSYGTWFSQTFAGRHPERLRSLVLDSAYPVVGQSPWYPEIATTPASPSTLPAGVRPRAAVCPAIPCTGSSNWPNRFALTPSADTPTTATESCATPAPMRPASRI
ncbi:MAG: alpha/beta fold hydrolase [Terriglobales bacterium]